MAGFVAVPRPTIPAIQPVYPDLSLGRVQPTGSTVIADLRDHVAGWVNVKQYSGASAVTGAHLASAAAQAATDGTGVLVAHEVTITTAVGTISVPVRFDGGGQLTVNTGGSVTISGPLSAPLSQIFDTSGGGTVTFSAKVPEVYPQWWGAPVNGTDTDSTAVAAAVATGRPIRLTQGTWGFSVPATSATSGVHIRGDGPGSTTVKALAGFTGSALFILGNKSTTTVTTNMQMEGMTLDSNSQAVTGLEIYGLRDGSGFDSLYVTGLDSVPGIISGQAGAGAGSATGRMNEGVQFRNVHVITFGDMQGTEFWRLDGLFESQLIGCKALGSSAADTFNSTGFRVGHYSEARGVALIGCSAGNMAGATGGNVGIRYGEWSRESWDEFTTYENIKGIGAYHHGSNTSGSVLPFLTKTRHPRVFNSATAGILDPVISIGDSQYVEAGPINGYNTGKVWVTIGSGATNSLSEIRTSSVAVDAISGDLVTFDPAADSGNTVRVQGSGSGVVRNAVISRLGLARTYPKGPVTATFSGTVAINAALGDHFTTTITNGGAHTVGAPSNPTSGQEITITVKSAYAAPATTGWNAVYHLAGAWVTAADGFNRSVTFRYDGSSWLEMYRTAADVAN